MRRGVRTFALGGLITAFAAVALGVWLGGGLSDQRTALFTAIVLVIGDVASAFVAAGVQEARARPVAWARVGLVAAALNFVGLWLLVIPPTFVAIIGGAGAAPIWTYTGVALAVAAGVIIVWYSHRLAWRRAAPKSDS
ncbi:MAG: hypothetical protein JNM59_07380 [Hyphomonadaceae bacterium]|nr:hypothetical protein [Hyphomonadaceae bacterium]